MVNIDDFRRRLVPLLIDGAKSGLGFGLAVSIVHLAIGIALIIQLGMPPLTWFAAKTVLIEVPLGVAFGVLCGPLHLLEKGRFIQPAVLTVIWIVMERFVAVDPAKPQMWLVPPIVGLILFYAFRWIWGKKWQVVTVLAVLVPIALLATPVVSYHLTGGYEMKEVTKQTDAPKGSPDVVLIVMDTVQAARVSAYGYKRETSPVFDAFAKEGVLFERATAPGTWSLSAHASLFTGAFPSVHKGHAETRVLDGSMPTLAESLAKLGYETFCFTANPHISSGFGLTRGFGWTDNAWLSGAGGRGFTFIYRLIDALGVSAMDKGGALVVDNITKWMKQRPKEGPPAFVFVNFLEAHFPFHQLPEEFRNAYTQESLSSLRSHGQVAFGVQMGRQLTQEESETIRQPIIDLYDGGIKYTDYLVGKVVDIWRKRGSLDRTVFVILADHGEHVGEHGMFGHLTSVYEEDLWVPLMIRYPPKIRAGSRITQEVSTVGVFSTIFDLVGLDPPDTLQVGSLVSGLEPGKEGEPLRSVGRPVIAERFEEELLSSRFKPGTANGKGPLLSPWGRYRTYRAGNFKLVKHAVGGEYLTYLFDLGKDPGELKDLAELHASMPDLERMEKELENWEIVLQLPPLIGEAGARSKPVVKPEISDEAREQLKALGYIAE